MDLLPILEKREKIAEVILTNEQLIIDYDRTRNTNREALNKLKKELKNEDKVWANFGNFFLKLENENVKTYIQEEQQNLEKEILSLRETIKEKAAELENLEKGEIQKMKGFDLKGITASDLYNITKHNDDKNTD
ncbi:9948_t:CDS:2 [Entrophospora sp. SA101]|nr:772_t:CDS:2 [Entrophospora sp. SA101]CAJ0635445.1 9948_t:CDS:2 [Entrophospora sp. SA101]CAJ0840670.1 11341_t:CDS:2 [Entrophospora sp. SA101]CAJ0846740.1 13544_t:CDS:2 [Entrophospora sp. SA101]CAJ0875548.1 11644_t:CDS:2 [Entrophospora sp. SA101]